MSDFDNQMQDIAGQGQDKVSDSLKRAGNKAAIPVKKMTTKAGHAMWRGGRKLAVKAGKAAVKGITKTMEALGKLIVKIVMLLGPIGCAVLVVLIMIGAAFNFWLDERGSTESNNLDPDIQNPMQVQDESGIMKAIAMTEPQAVTDAYYKFMSTSSYVKSFGSHLFEFNDPDDTSDFAGLRDYNKIETNFYLSDDFIRSTDEMLHNDEFYYPEQVIKPVYGQNMTLKDKNGDTSTVYTSRLPLDSPSGEKMLDSEIVKDFDEMLADGYTMSAPGVTDDIVQLLPQSQTPTETTATETNLDGTVTTLDGKYYSLAERNVIDDTYTGTTESGVWDYGFASVLEYSAQKKISYIDCTYDSADVDFDYKVWVEPTATTEGYWDGPYHGCVISMPVTGSLESFTQACQDKCDELEGSNTKISYSANLPTNIKAIISNTEKWAMSSEPNSAAEAVYARDVMNSHIDAKILNSWDADIDRLQFDEADLQSTFGNPGKGLYPLNIAVVSHAATFSGNIHYTITPAGEPGCDKTVEPLNPNSEPSKDHRIAVQTISVAGGCASASLTAHRTGNLITMTPKIEETDSPWGFEYIEQYANHYRSYAPKDYVNDREFMVRTGIEAPDGTAERDTYLKNLEYLMSLGLLRLYSGNINYGAVGSVDLSTMSDNMSDLNILARLIAAEAGPNKLDELMVGSVAVNRVASDRFPNTFWEVVSQGNGGQYACYADGNFQNAKPTDREIASAVQVLSGQFSIPENVLGQSANVQGKIFMLVDNPGGLVDHYYCAMPNGTAISTVDRYGRPAMSEAQARAKAAELEGKTSEQAEASAVDTLDYSTIAFVGDFFTETLNSTKALTGNGATVITNSSGTLSDLKDTIDASSALTSSIKTVYLLAGTSDSTINDSTFSSLYQDLVTAISAKAPGARIVLTSLPPVVDGVSSTSNAYINGKNTVIQQIATSNGYQILDLHSVLVDNGQLKSKYGADGTNLTAAAYNAWFTKIQQGFTSSSMNTEDSTQFTLLNQSGEEIYSKFTLYDISEYDILQSTYMQARVVQAESGLVASLKKLVGDIVDSVTSTISEFIKMFFDTTSKALLGVEKDRTLDTCYYYSAPTNNYDVRSVIYHTISFSTQSLFSTAESVADQKAEDQDLSFLFVGKMSSLGLGTTGAASLTMVPGITTTVEGMISPTSTYYAPLTPYSLSSGYMEISTPQGTNVLAVADGTITEIGTNASDARGKYVIETAVIDGHTYVITYGYLDSVNVGTGASVSSGDLIGVSGKRTDGAAGMYLSVKKDGTTVDPSTIFYQSSYAYGGSDLWPNLYNADGSVNESAIAALETSLYSEGINDAFHTPPTNGLERFQCTWWAYGRGLNYLVSNGRGDYKSEYDKIRGHGGQYAANNSAHGVFNSGSMPKPHSLACFPGSPYGHITYVEAVDYVNKCYYVSEAGSGVAFYGITKRSFNYISKYGTPATFIYLDEPLK